MATGAGVGVGTGAATGAGVGVGTGAATGGATGAGVLTTAAPEPEITASLAPTGTVEST